MKVDTNTQETYDFIIINYLPSRSSWSRTEFAGARLTEKQMIIIHKLIKSMDKNNKKV